MSVALPPSASLPSSNGPGDGTPKDPFHWLGVDWRGIARPLLALATYKKVLARKNGT